MTRLANMDVLAGSRRMLSGWSWPSRSRSRSLISPLLSGMGESSRRRRGPDDGCDLAWS
jgi:hypothetical protein